MIFTAWGHAGKPDTLVAGLGPPHFADGQFYNPAVPVYGPRAYPPVFPLLLAPLYRQFGPMPENSARKEK